MAIDSGGDPARSEAPLQGAQAFDEVGGVDYLVEVGRSDPRTFCMLLARLLPAELKVGGAIDSVPLVVIKDFAGSQRGV